ncbi:MAG: transposase [Proteobacteria bacterium]|nr:transposase [Pseudomonadota bacterium]
MTQPRQYLPGSTYMLTRRVVGRHYLLRPDELVSQIYLYCLATMSEKHGIAVHGFTLMSSHAHLTVTDTRGEMGAFLRDFHRLVANAMKLVRDWDGILWDGSEPSVVRLETPHAFVQQAAYLIANPVSGGAVPRSKQWPGLIVHADELGRKCWTVKRPDLYFDAESWPKTATLKLKMPEDLGMTDAQVREAVAEEAERLEQEARDAMRAKGRSFMGVEKVLSVSPQKRATTPEPHAKRNPTFAVGRHQPEAYRAAVEALRAFRTAYRDALHQWRQGLRSVQFPAGTYLMRWLHHVDVAPAPG